MAASLLTVLQVSAPEDAQADNLPDVKQPSTGERTACNKGSSINYVIADRGGGVSSKDYGIT